MDEKCACGETHTAEEEIEAYARLAESYRILGKYQLQRVAFYAAFISLLGVAYVWVGFWCPVALLIAFVMFVFYGMMGDSAGTIAALGERPSSKVKIALPKDDHQVGGPYL